MAVVLGKNRSTVSSSSTAGAVASKNSAPGTDGSRVEAAAPEEPAEQWVVIPHLQRGINRGRGAIRRHPSTTQPTPPRPAPANRDAIHHVLVLPFVDCNVNLYNGCDSTISSILLGCVRKHCRDSYYFSPFLFSSKST
jgi:hypothetical protein